MVTLSLSLIEKRGDQVRAAEIPPLALHQKNGVYQLLCAVITGNMLSCDYLGLCSLVVLFLLCIELGCVFSVQTSFWKNETQLFCILLFLSCTDSNFCNQRTKQKTKSDCVCIFTFRCGKKDNWSGDGLKFVDKTYIMTACVEKFSQNKFSSIAKFRHFSKMVLVKRGKLCFNFPQIHRWLKYSVDM